MCKLYLQHASFKIKWRSFRIILFILLTGLSAQTLAQALRFDHGTGHIVGGGVTYNTHHQLLKYAVPRMPDSQRMTIGGISVYALAHNQRLANTKVMVSVATGQISIGKNGKKSRQLPLQGSIASINNQLTDLHFFADDKTGNEVIVTLTSTSENIKANRIPIAPAVININLDEDESTQTNIFAQVRDPDGDTLSLNITQQPQHGRQQNSNGIVTYTPDKNFHGKDSIVLTVDDGNGGKAATTLNIVVNSINDAMNTPAVLTHTGDEDQSIIVDILTQATDVDGDKITIADFSQGQNGSVSVDNGQVRYTPNTDYNGTDTFTVTLADGNGSQTAVAMNVTINPVNDTPIAPATANISTDEDTQVRFDGVARAQDVDGDALTAKPKSQPQNGSVSIENNQWVYTPKSNFHGIDNFVALIDDGNSGSVETAVTITVNPVNDLVEQIQSQLALETLEDNALTVDVFTQSGISDADHTLDQLTMAVVQQPTKGSLTIRGGQLTYTPEPNDHGQQTIIVAIQDPEGSSVSVTITVNVTPVNDMPTAPTSINQAANEDNSITIDAAAQAQDIDGDSLTATPKIQPENGNISVKNNQLVYTPNKDFNGQDSFITTIDDGNGGTVETTINLTIEAVNDTPIITANTHHTGNEDEKIAVPTIQLDDVDANNGNLRLNLSVTNGILTFATTTGLSFPAPEFGNDSANVIVQGKLGTLQAALPSLQYQGHENYEGTDTLTLIANDLGNTGTGGALASDTKTIALTINPVNDVPTITLTPPQTTPEFIEDQGPITFINGQISDVDNATLSKITLKLLQNPDGNDETLAMQQLGTALSSSYANGSLTITGTGTLADYTNVLNNITYDNRSQNPNPNNRTVEIIAFDIEGQSTAVNAPINITPINDAPEGKADHVTVAEDTPEGVTIDVIANDSDPENNKLRLGGTQSTSSDDYNISTKDGKIVFIPAENVNGTVEFTYTVTDGKLNDTQPVTVTITPVNDAPILAVTNTISMIEGEAKTLNQSDIHATDIDNIDGNLTLQMTANDYLTCTVNGTLGTTFTQTDVNNGLVKCTPSIETTEDINAALQITVSDGELSQTKSTTLAIQHKNRAPVQSVPVDAIPGLINGITKLTEPAVNDADAKDKSLSVSFTAAYGHFSVTNTEIQVSGNNSNNITITAPLTTLLNLFSNSQVEYHAPHDISGDITITMFTSDNGNTGIGGAKVAQDEFTISLNTLNLADVNEKNGFVIAGPEENALIGRTVQAVGDVNNDGYQDLAFSNPYFNSHGRIYILFGSAAGLYTTTLNALNGINGFIIDGQADDDYLGHSISSGDINNDGKDDIIIGASRADNNGENSGAAYVIFGQTTFPANLPLNTLNGQNGFSIHGEKGDHLGNSVSSGDINNDGKDDIIIGASDGSKNGILSSATYVIFGQTTFPANLPLNTLNGQNGFRIYAETAGYFLGSSVSSGDINNDGKDDIIIGADGIGHTTRNPGTVYVIFGKTTFPTNLNLNTLNGQNGFSLHDDKQNSLSSHHISSGDINDDGTDDIIIGKPTINRNDAHSAGVTYVIFGQTTFPANVALSTLNGANGFSMYGEKASDYFGYSTSSGDINNDGKDDIIIGAPGADTNGISSGNIYVVFGQETFPTSLNLSTLNGQSGFSLRGEEAYNFAGIAVNASDTNNDGKDDILIGAYNAHTATARYTGKVYVIHGQNGFGRK